MITYLTDDNRPIEIDWNEAIRYAGGQRNDPQLNEMFSACWQELQPVLSCRACYTTFPISLDKKLHLGFATVESKALAKNLTGCTHILLFAATIGAGADRLIQRYSRISPARAVCMQAVSAAAIEAYCDLLNIELIRPFAGAKPRFSPGYGDLPLQLQQNIQQALQFEKIGITLTDSGLMAPSKSVTAMIGVY